MAHLRPDTAASRNHPGVTFTLEENHLVDGGHDMTTFDFQSLLSNMSSFELKIKSEILVMRILLQTAVYDRTSNAQYQVRFVENMTCFENYTGLSCETCAPGRNLNEFGLRLHGEYNTSLATWKHHVNLLLQSLLILSTMMKFPAYGSKALG